MYGIIRLYIGIVVLLMGVLFRKKLCKGDVNLYFKNLFIIVALIPIITFFFPFENLFISFPSAIESYHYVQEYEVKLQVDGENSALLLGEIEPGAYTQFIVPKEGNEWKIGRAIDVNEIDIIEHSVYLIDVFRYKNSDDYYIQVMTRNGGTLDITDNRNNDFACLITKYEQNNTIFKRYYAYVNDLNQDYILIINGERINMLKE